MFESKCFNTLIVFLVFFSIFQGCFRDSQSYKKQNDGVLHSTVVFHVRGNVYPSGYFYTTLKMGEPPRPYDLDIDTGSDLTWVHCDAPCVNCPKSPHQPYKPRNNALTCKHSMCTILQHPPNYPCANPTDQCDYEIEYADHGSSFGVVVQDNFSFEFFNGSVGRPFLAFGCGYDQDLSSSSNPPFVDGVLGLANRKSSIVSQLYDSKMTRNVFGHCFGSQGGGYLFFGDEIIPSKTVWVPVLKNRIGNYYSIGPAEVLFDGKNVMKTGFSFVLDSGSTYTYFSGQLYEAAISMIKKNIDVKHLKSAPEDKTLPCCWKGSKRFNSINDVQKFFKPLSLRFSKTKNAIMEMPPEAYLIISKNGNACLGILDGSEAELRNLNVLGDVSLLNKVVIYDNEKDQIGWTKANCDSFPKHLAQPEDGYDEL
ncbi:hypothetical protein RND81_03G063600 [Saponaria officinalis]|uniref:Aspartic proteinase Asp1 n=2 Tax=Saponaria officinalis TaxID=3572 RepID=A0AAW1LYQ1_SAPOF